MGLISKIKENSLKRQQEKRIEVQKEKERLMSLSEKELMIEMILKLNEVSDKCDDIKQTVIVWSD
ncbi:MAG: hypothetical protein IKJ14_07110 [Clostridia bacterium]|nr:hypothetical protein [Clostridia bacterium]